MEKSFRSKLSFRRENISKANSSQRLMIPEVVANAVTNG